MVGLLLNWRIWAAAGLALALAGTHWKAYTGGKRTVQDEWNIERLEIGRQSQALKDATAKSIDKASIKFCNLSIFHLS